MSKPKFVLMLYAPPIRKYLSDYSYVLQRLAAYMFTKNHNVKNSPFFQWDDGLVENKLGEKRKYRVA